MTAVSQRKKALSFALFFGALSELLFGYDSGIAGIALLSVGKTFELTPALSGFVVSSLLLGAAVGVGVAGRIADRIGRRPALLIVSGFFILGGLVTALAPHVWVLILGRFIMGIGVGGSASVVTVYLIEVAPARTRGRIGSLGQLMVVFGILLAYVAGYALQPLDAWRWMLGLSVIPGVVIAVGLLALPESPRWLVTKGRRDEARTALQRLRGGEVHDELSELERANARLDASTRSASLVLRAMFSRLARRNTVAAALLAVLVQFVGTNSIIYYAPNALVAAGFTEAGAAAANVSVGLVNLIFTLIGLAIVDRFRRRALLTLGVSVMVLAMLYLTTVNLTPVAHTTAGGFLTLVGMLVFLAAFAVSWGLLVRVVVSELFPSSIRGTATGLVLVLNWLANFVVGLTFPSLLAISAALSFGIFTVTGLIALLFVRRVLPETGGGARLEDVAPSLHASARAGTASSSR